MFNLSTLSGINLQTDNYFQYTSNASAFYLKRKCVCDKTQVRFTSNARAFDSKRKGVFGEFGKGKYDGLSGLAGIFIKCIYAGCGTSVSYLFHTCI